MSDKHTLELFDPIKNEIQNLKADYAVVPDCSTKDGFEQAKKDFRYIRKFEINLDKARKKLNEADQERIRMRNAEAKKIDAALKEISGPFKQAVDKRKDEIEALEAARVEGIQKRINDIENFVSEAIGKDSETISGIIEAVDLIEVDETFQEFQSQALKAIETTKQQLAQALQNALVREENERLRQEAEELRKQTAEAMEAAQDVEVNTMPAHTARGPSDVKQTSHEEAEQNDHIWQAFQQHVEILNHDPGLVEYDLFRAGFVYGCEYTKNQE